MITIPLLRDFDANCTLIGVKTPTPVIRALELHEAAYAFITPPTRSLLELQDDELGDVLTDLALRRHTGEQNTMGIQSGLGQFEEQLLAEVRTATLPLLDALVEGMQSVFDEVAKPIVRAVVEYGFTDRTEPAEVLLRRRQDDADAFMAARDALAGLQPLVAFRQTVSRTFEVDVTANPADYSVCFAAGDNWSSDGMFNRQQRHPGIVNITALARGGVRLNTPTEARSKLEQRRWADVLEQPADHDLRPGAEYPVLASKGA